MIAVTTTHFLSEEKKTFLERMKCLSRQSIIQRLPDEIVLIIRSYAIDMETRISMLLENLQKQHGPVTPFETLVKTFTSKQLTSVFNAFVKQHWDETRYMQCYLKNVDVPPISYTYGRPQKPWDPPNSPPYAINKSQHPVANTIRIAVLDKFPRQRQSQIQRLFHLFTFLRYTSIYHNDFDHAIRKQAYDLLAGLILLKKYCTHTHTHTHTR
jgi:hypothetical protein